MNKIAGRIEKVKEGIASACGRSGRDPESVKLVIVSKSAELENILEVMRLGYTEFGESRVQRLKNISIEVENALKEGAEAALLKSINWHLIGHLQRNKVRQILSAVSLIHSVDTLRLAEEINSSSAKEGLCSRVLLQVNTSGEPQKYGVPVGAATHLAEQIETMPYLKLAGLMVMAPLTHNTDVIRACFVRARELFYEMMGEKIVGAQFMELSMGMSSDYEIAIEEGSTILRIGSAIFAG